MADAVRVIRQRQVEMQIVKLLEIAERTEQRFEDLQQLLWTLHERLEVTGRAVIAIDNKWQQADAELGQLQQIIREAAESVVKEQVR